MMDNDFRSVFAMEAAPLEIVLRATLVYLGLCVLMRVIPKRHAGTIAPNDVVLAVVIGGVAVAAMAKKFMSVPGVLIIIGTVLGWNYLLDWLATVFRSFAPISASRLPVSSRMAGCSTATCDVSSSQTKNLWLSSANKGLAT